MYKTQEYNEYSRRLVRSLGFAVLRHMQWKVNVFKVHSYNMIKGCLHLPLFLVYICSEFLGFYLLIFSFYCSCRPSAPDLHCWWTTFLLLIAIKQHKQTKLRKSALNDMATIVTTQERFRTKLSLSEHDFQGWKCNGEDNYTLVVIYL